MNESMDILAHFIHTAALIVSNYCPSYMSEKMDL